MTKQSVTKKQCQEYVNKFNKAGVDDLAPVIENLITCIPEFTLLIITDIYSKVINYLSTPSLPEEITESILNMLYKMSTECDTEKTETNPYNVFISNQEFLTALFMHTDVDQNGQFDQRVISLIFELFVKKGEGMAQFILNSKDSVDLLMRGLANEGRGDVKAASLMNQIFVCKQAVTELLTKDIITYVKNFAPNLALDVMIHSLEVRNTMNQEEFQQWALNQESLTMSDVSLIFERFYPSLWNDSFSIQLILKTTPPDASNLISLFHKMPPLEIEVPEELTKKAVSQLLEPPYTFKIIENSEKTKRFDTRDLYYFTRLFCLSASNPNHVNPDDLDKIYEFISSRDESVSLAATQVVTLWIIKYHFQVDYKVTYRCAELIEIRKKDYMKNLYKILLHYLATLHSVAEMILRTEPSLRYSYDSKMEMIMKRSTWEFPSFTQFIQNVPTFDQYDQEKMLLLLGGIAEYLGIEVDEDNPEPAARNDAYI